MGRALLAPEILQVSSMDCGVAALACMLAGHGVSVSYEKLRERCQTSVDGTNIDSLEEMANSLGLDVMQHLVPPDLLWDVAARRMPAIAVSQLHDARNLHFVVLWRGLGSRVQVMDPAGGRRWPRRAALESQLYVHPQLLHVDAWRQWMETSTFRDALEARAVRLLSRRALEGIARPVLASLDPHPVGALDAALRLVDRTLASSGSRSRAWTDELFTRAWHAALTGDLPAAFVSIVRQGDQVLTRGVLLLAPPEPVVEQVDTAVLAGRTTELGLSDDRATPVAREALGLLGPDGRRLLAAVGAGACALALTSALEMLLYRAALDVPRLFSTGLGRSGVALAVGVFVVLAAALEVLVTLGGSRLSQRLELGARMRTLHLLPRVPDDFIQSRPTSDLAYRAHGLSSAGAGVSSILSAARAGADLAITLVAIGLLDPRYALASAVGAGCYAATALLFRSRLGELDTRLQIHASRLQILLLDALRGVRPVRLHGFQPALRNEQHVELERWKRSAEAQFDATGALQAAYTLVSTLLVGSLFALFLWRSGDPRTFVLLALWSLRLPAAVQRLVQFAQSFPQQRNALVRTLEITRQTPLADVAPAPESRAGVAISLRDVDVVASGQQVLREVSVDIPAGQHVAIVGPSGSGKSTLVSLLLGLQRPARGTIAVDGAPFDDASARALRPSIAWIDPAVQLWNTTFSQNFEYAAAGRKHRAPQEVLEQSDLLGVLASLEHGLDTPVGADGAFLSGGEGQRLRLGRALLPAETRLAILDEAFRGLEREVRERLAVRVRAMLPRTTVLFVSHDVRQALSFERVLVVEDGRIVEDGVPAMLAAEDSRFAEMLRAERDLLERSWGGPHWRTLRVADGHVQETGRGVA